MTTRKKIWIVVAIIVPIIILGILYSLGEVMARLERVDQGLARPDWPYSDYTVEELGKLYPQYRNNDDVVTTRTPEETHKLFIEKLKANDIDGALECCVVKGKWDYLREGLNRDISEGKIQTMISEIENIKKESDWSETVKTYSYMTVYKGYEIGAEIEFRKNNQGIWMITSI